jgi:hypothetical protein
MKQKIISPTLTYWTFIGVLAFIAYLLFSSHIYAQSPSTQSLSNTQKRLNALKEYQASSNRFAWLGNYPEAKKLYDMYLMQIEVGVVEGDRCRVNLEQQTSQQRKDCDRNITTHYKKVRNFYRLMKYQELLNGKKNICVKADLGVNPPLLARGIAKPNFSPDPNNPKETGLTEPSTVYLCNDGDPKRKLRVRASNGHYVKLTPQDLARPELNIANLPPAANLAKLMEKLDLK